ncbi:MAG: MATE family efflux transporter [Bacteroidales bacterium]|nr:MATE family efflux transporter [Bacteroidales bacterium]MDD4670954.1 MATE family efflux transporter [Bacteroidales bacterium]
MNKQILRLAVPSILANITVPLVGIVDLGIAGHLGNAAAIGGIAIGSMLFDLLYWNMGFLRVGTGGITAQAFGRKDFRSAMNAFTQGIATALSVALIIWIIQWVYIEAAFALVECTPEVETLAKQYFFIRVWAAPATLSLMVFKGWFIGMQNTVLPMTVDIVVNVINLFGSYLFAVYTPLGIKGVAVGTLVAQYSGLILAIILMSVNFKKYLPLISVRASVKWKYMKHFFAMNGNLFVRSFCMLVIYIGFTSIAAKYGDTMLAVSSVMMKLLLLYSYFVDGFAYAGEALTGRFIGENDSKSLHEVVKKLFVWCLGLGIVSTVVYSFLGEPMFRLMTDNVSVIEASRQFLFWLLLMPLVSCVAFTWDGIFIGATASKALRDCMLWSAGLFVLSYVALQSWLGIQALYTAYFVHLLVRTVYMTIVARKEVYSKVKIAD